jgi:tRNA threonylcarbamoyl adenosine modification protein YeaZ
VNILILDTSSKYLSLAVVQDNKVSRQMHRRLDRKHSLQLIPLVDKILKKARLPLKEIDGFCISRGPGSFTGLRIGITTIKGLSFVVNKPVVAIPSLDILAQNANKIRKAPEQICPIVDAKQNKVYACLYQAGNGKLVRKSPYLLLPVEELLRRLQGKVLFLGDGLKIYRKQIHQNRKIKPVFAEERFWYPRAAKAASLAVARFKRRRFNDVNRLVPLYLYPKDCQIKKR